MSQDELETPADAVERDDSPGAHPLCRLHPITRAALFFAGVLLPAVCFLFGCPERPHWQTGKWDAYAQLLLSYEATFALYAFLLYPMVCMTLLVFWPAKYRDNRVVRFGIYSGVLIAAEYWVVLELAVPGEVACFSVLALPAMVTPLFAQGVVRYASKWESIAIFAGLGVVMVLFSALLDWMPILFLVVLCLASSTAWAFAAYLAVSIWLIRGNYGPQYQFSLAWLMGAFTWFAAHLGAWRLSFTIMLQEYASLPTQPPPSDCFVCTAAAGGHPRVVRSEEVRRADGSVRRVNDQLRALKAFELLLVSISPKAHRRFRRAYNWLGPRVAARLTHPLAADVAYLAIKPLEWTATACLRLAIPGQAGLIRELYGRTVHNSRRSLP